MTTAPSFVAEVLTAAPQAKLLNLVLLNENGQVLLGRKKRGFGEGYWNGFGGKVEPGETVEEAAKRELLEEAGLTAHALEEVGLLSFVFDDGKHWLVHVFSVAGYSGEPTESDEMAPQWFSHADVPYHQMWADDPHWWPHFLAGRKFRGLFAFADTTRLVWHWLEGMEREQGLVPFTHPQLLDLTSLNGSAAPSPPAAVAAAATMSSC